MICRGLALKRSCGQKVLSSVWTPSGKLVFWPATKRGRRLLCISFCTGTKASAWPSDRRAAEGNAGSSGSEKASVGPARQKQIKPLAAHDSFRFNPAGMGRTCDTDRERQHHTVNSVCEEVCPLPGQLWGQLLQHFS